MEPKAKHSSVRDSWRAVVDWFNALELSENTILIAFALVIGVF